MTIHTYIPIYIQTPHPKINVSFPTWKSNLLWQNCCSVKVLKQKEKKKKKQKKEKKRNWEKKKRIIKETKRKQKDKTQ